MLDTFFKPIFFLGLLLCFGCEKNAPTLFKSMPSDQTGITFSNVITENETYNILEYEYVYNGGGVGLADFDNNGLPDLFFSGNMVENQLYLNRGDFKFTDISEVAGIGCKDRWSTGVAVVDINNDGWQDLYVCASTYLPGAKRANTLFINQGLNENDIPVFKDMSAAYGIADTSNTMDAAFFDYDNDGDLDLYLAVNEMSKKMAPNVFRKLKEKIKSQRIDRLYRNDFDVEKGHPVFTDVSKEAGIVHEGYTLGISIVDINQDGWKDVYLTNDYLSNDLFYLNNQDGTFTNRSSEWIKHTSYSAMGNDVVDINNDGWSDIVALDMLPEDNYRRKTMLPGVNYSFYLNNERYGYQYQYVRNTLQLHAGRIPDSKDMIFSEVAMFAGMSSTDWSWAPLVADFDNDSDRDIIVTNGFPKDVTDRDFSDYQADKARLVAQKEMLKLIPSVKIKNYAFQNQLAEEGWNTSIPKFKKVSEDWGINTPSFSNGAVYADLDDDGDLDYVVNNIDEEAFVFQNTLVGIDAVDINYLKVKFQGAPKNKNGLGATVTIFYDGQMQTWENTPYRGYLSSALDGLHFGLGKNTGIDSLVVKWQEGPTQVLSKLKANQTLILDFKNASNTKYLATQESPIDPLFTSANSSTQINFNHPESDYIDFNVQRLLLHKLSQYGPSIAVGDINNDDLDDFYVGGSHFNKGQFFIQEKNGTFTKNDLLPGEDGDAKREEELGTLFFDADNDGDDDLYLVSGGYEFDIKDTVYQDRLFINDNGNFALAKNALPTILSSGSCVKAADYDRDGDLDLFVGGRVLPNEFPMPVTSYLLKNDGKGKFTIANQEEGPALENIGLICDALWTDYDNDGWVDLMLAGEWMPLQIFKNNKGTFDADPLIVSPAKGWWNSLVAADFDLDGDMDYLAGNLGLNTLLKASEERPLMAYATDFDGNKGLDFLPTNYFIDRNGKETEFPYFGRVDTEKQVIKVKGAFPRHAKFGEASMQEILNTFPEAKPMAFEATHLQSVYIENLGDGNFEIRDLPVEAQIAPVYGMLSGDFNGDHFPDVLLTGNDYGTELGMGRYDAFNGLLLVGDGKGSFASQSIAESGIIIPVDGKSLSQLQSANGESLILAGQNSGPLKVFKATQNKRIIWPLLPYDCTAKVYLKNGRSYREELPYGHSFLSQSARKIWLPNEVDYIEIQSYNGDWRKITSFDAANDLN